MKPEKDIPNNVDELLREYLLEQDANSPPSESMLHQMADTVFQAPPLVTPSAEKEAALLNKLKSNFHPQPGPTPSTSWWQNLNSPWVLAGAGIGAAILTTLLITNPFKKEDVLAYDTNATQPIETPALQEKETNVERKFDDLIVKEEKNVILEDNSSDNKLELVPGTEKSTNSTAKSNLPLEAAGDPTNTFESAVKTSSDENPGEINRIPADLPAPLDLLFAHTLAPSSSFFIDGSRDTAVVGPGGTLLHFSAGSFKTREGKAVAGQVRIALKEVYKKSDIILSNLPTRLGEDVLVSGGAIHLEAWLGNKPLKLSHNKNIYVEFANKGQAWQSEMTIYSAQENEFGDMTWKDRGGKINSLVPIPIKDLNFSQYVTNKKSHKKWDELVKGLDHPRYENTAIATRQFVDRLRSAHKLGCVPQILMAYVDELQAKKRNLYEVDMAVANYMRGNYRNYEFVNPKSMKTESFDRYADELWGRVEPFYANGVNMNRTGAEQALTRKGLSVRNADKMVRLDALSHLYLKELNHESATALTVKGAGKQPDMTSWSRSKRSRGFAITTLGWSRLGMILPPVQKGKKFNLTVLPAEEFDSWDTKTFLVFPRLNSVITGEYNSDGAVVFKDLPRGMDGQLVSLTYAGNNPYIWKASILMDKAKELEIKFSESELDRLRSDLRKLD